MCTDDFGEDGDASRPFSSSAVLQAGHIRTLLGGGVAKFRTDSGSSSGMFGCYLSIFAALVSVVPVIWFHPCFLQRFSLSIFTFCLAQVFLPVCGTHICVVLP